MDVELEQRESLKLFIFLVEKIVGSDKYVRRVRRILAIKDRLISAGDPNWTVITSGSRGEGVDIGGSDIDIMFVDKSISVSETIPVRLHSRMSYFRSEPDSIYPGYVNLELIPENALDIRGLCYSSGKGRYLSNILFKEAIKEKLSSCINTKIHGPCYTDEDEIMDYAPCVHSPMFPYSATEWVHRPNVKWPSDYVKRAILKHGVLFVPVGKKGSSNEEIQWRTSFSIAEKFLIYSLNHTQLVCYALMKIIVKDVLQDHPTCKGILCSYFVKTIFFWVMESICPNEWRPNNLFWCSMQCLKRLTYCVEYMNCPHYFIPKINLFESKLSTSEQQSLLQALREMSRIGWHSFFLPRRIYKKFCTFLPERNALLTDIHKLLHTELVLTSLINIRDNELSYGSAVQLMTRYRTTSMKQSILQWLSNISTKVGESRQYLPFNVGFRNTYFYTQHKISQSYLLQGTQFGAVTGWIYLALLFLKMKHYEKALYLLQHCQSECTWEKLQDGSRLIADNKRAIYFLSHVSTDASTILKFLFMEDIILHPLRPLCPREIYDEFNCFQFHPAMYIHPRVCIYFLLFLCYFHLKEEGQCQRAMKELQKLTTDGLLCKDTDALQNPSFTEIAALPSLYSGRQFLDRPDILSTIYYCLGVMYELLDDIYSAIECYRQSIEVHPDRYNISYKRLHRLTE